MINIRRKTFETNSSSTHSICICKSDEEIEIPEEMEIELKDYNYEFGWEYTEWNNPTEKLAYIILGIIARSWHYTSLTEACSQIEKILNNLSEFGVKKVKITGLEIILYDKKCYIDNKESYVDHGSEMGELIEEILNNKDSLKNFLFSYKSFILGGNDNEDGYQKINANYEHKEFYKGN